MEHDRNATAKFIKYKNISIEFKNGYGNGSVTVTVAVHYGYFPIT